MLDETLVIFLFEMAKPLTLFQNFSRFRYKPVVLTLTLCSQMSYAFVVDSNTLTKLKNKIVPDFLRGKLIF